MNKTEDIGDTQDVERSLCVLLAEPNPLMREKIAGMLFRHRAVWCVINVRSESDLIRSAVHHHPDLVLAELNILRDKGTVESLRRISPFSRIVALADSGAEPYVAAAHRLGLDGLIERALAGEKLFEQLDFPALSRDG